MQVHAHPCAAAVGALLSGGTLKQDAGRWNSEGERRHQQCIRPAGRELNREDPFTYAHDISTLRPVSALALIHQGDETPITEPERAAQQAPERPSQPAPSRAPSP